MHNKFLLAVCAVCASATHAAVFQDSFDDNSRDRSIWAEHATYIYPTNTPVSVHYSEQNQRLEFTVAGVATNEFTAQAWQDSLTMLTAEMNWTLMLNVHNSAAVTESNLVEIGIGLYHHGWGADSYLTGFFLRSTSEGISLYGYANEKFDFPEPLTTDGSIRISYTATNQTLEFAYANAPNNQYHPVTSLDTSGWIDIKSTGFILDTWACSDGEEVESGEVFIDNIIVDYEIMDVAVGQMFLATTQGEARLSLQLEKSEDLVAWTNVGSAIEWVLPVETNQQFFRVRAAP